jgi:hypothetical protein
MANKFFKKIRKFLTKEEDAGETGDETIDNQEIKEKNKSGIHTKLELIECVINSLKGMRYVDTVCKAMCLHVFKHADEIAFIAILESLDFETELKRKLKDAGINLGQNWEFKYIITENEPRLPAQKIMEGLWLELIYNTGHTGSKAKISAEKGQLTSAEFILENGNAIYNIGRGANPLLDSGNVHRNQIVIADDEFPGITEENLKINRFVSRKHACIQYRKGDGFVVKVYDEGTRLKGNRTRILRNVLPDPVDLNNPFMEYPLEDGDRIELGKSVILKFSILKD